MEWLSNCLRGTRTEVTAWKRASVPSWLYYLDVFSFTPIPRHGKGRMHSFRGLSVSIAVGIVCIVYMVYTTLRLLSDEPSLAVLNAPADAAAMNFPPHGFVFRPTAAPETFYDPSYFTFSFVAVSILDSGANVSQQSLGVARCNFSFAGSMGTNAICPAATPSLRGHDQSIALQYYRVDVSRCNNATSNVTCKPADVIDDLIERGEFEFLVIYDDYNGVTPETVLYTIGSQHLNFFERLHRRLVLIDSPNLVYRFKPESRDIISFMSERSFVKRFNGTYMTIIMQLDSQQWTETHSTSTLEDLVASWYGFYGGLVLVLGVYLTWYNESKFYQKYPGWDDVGDCLLTSSIAVAPAGPSQQTIVSGAVAVTVPPSAPTPSPPTTPNSIPMQPILQPLLLPSVALP